MFFSPLNHFEPVQIFTFQAYSSLFSLDSMAFTIILTFVLLHAIFFFALYHKPFFPSRLQALLEYSVGRFYPFFKEKPFKIYRGLVPFYISLFITLAFFNILTIFIPLFYPIAIQFFITFYLSGFVMGSAFLILFYRYRD